MRLCSRYVCVACVLPQNQYTGAEQQQYNCRSRVSSSFLCTSSPGFRVWLVHSRRSSNGNNSFMSDATIKHTSSDLVSDTRKHTAVAKAVAHFLFHDLWHFLCVRRNGHHWKERLCSPLFDPRRPGDIKLTPSQLEPRFRGQTWIWYREGFRGSEGVCHPEGEPCIICDIMYIIGNVVSYKIISETLYNTISYRMVRYLL